MNPELLEKYNKYMLAMDERPAGSKEEDSRHALTISRETGAGAITVARMVTEILEKNRGETPSGPWAVFEQNLVQKVLEDHLLPEEFERYLPEEAVDRISDFSEEFFGLHPSSWTLVQKTNQTILKLAAKGNVVLIGRGAHLVAAKLPHVLHVRLVAPLDFRIKHIEQHFQLDRKAAIDFIKKEDEAKNSYLTRNFRSEVLSNLNFHLIVNTGRLGFPKSAQLIAEAIMHERKHEEDLQPA